MKTLLPQVQEGFPVSEAQGHTLASTAREEKARMERRFVSRPVSTRRKRASTISKPSSLPQLQLCSALVLQAMQLAVPPQNL